MKIPYQNNLITVTQKYKNGHPALDMVGLKSKNIIAVEDGLVLRSRWVQDGSATSTWGNYITLKLSDGKQLIHAHLSKRLVNAGDYVKKGQVIGIEGTTGYSTGNHLHWELRDANNQNLDICSWSGIPNALGTPKTNSEVISEPHSDKKETASSTDIENGSTVIITKGAKYTNGVPVPQRYLNIPYLVTGKKPGASLLSALNSWVPNEFLLIQTKNENAKSEDTFSVGDQVTIIPGAVYINNTSVPSRCIGVLYTLQKIIGNRGLLKEIQSWVNLTYLKKGAKTHE